MEIVGNKISEGLEAFLGLLRYADEMNRISISSEQEQNDRQQDALHDIELKEFGYHETAKLAKKLREIRKERRIAKDNQEVLLPLVDWINARPEVIKQLERVLGDVRKRERHLENRIYVPRAKERT